MLFAILWVLFSLVVAGVAKQVVTLVYGSLSHFSQVL